MPPRDSSRFSGDVAWNLAATAVLGAAGVALNAGIGRFYGAETFGVFSQVLAVYVVLSQLAVGGFGFSTLRFAADAADDPERAGPAIGAALVLTAGLAAAVVLAAGLCLPWIARFFDSPDVATGLAWALPGLWFFALDKVLLFGLNGLGRMRAHAAGVALRSVLVVAAFAGLTAAGAPGPLLPAALSLGEVVVFAALVVHLTAAGILRPVRPRAEWLSRHLRAGGRGFFGGLLLDANTRVDVVMLGYFAPDRVVGIYGFAAMWAEGLYQIVYVVQTNLAPVLSRLRLEGRMGEVRGLVRRNARRLPPALAAIALVVAWAFPTGALWLTGDPAFADGRAFFAVLAAGLVLASTLLPFGFVLNQWGGPGWFALHLALWVAANVVLNAALIPWLGALGAAIATAVATVGSMVSLVVLTRLATGQRL